MAFGITKKELMEWKEKVDRNEIAFLTHLWSDVRFPEMKTVTKVGCKDLNKLIQWGKRYGLKREWIHIRDDGYSHFDLLGKREREILQQEGIPYPFDD
ncbi:hypothetical protein [Fervidibacillus halotolerans]|uniref:YneQ n=1 Tax=Fervidibacillus halotolerans TaxID=2980027 RepID=A0A9E8M2Z8_9BACI|nr:hypothetical protein [Fervidibacillus halotolerans]WAA13464.1 hypothetical protein OE105_04955 [Fervidibacillus halotolerans]